jgi:hypothetical protein
MKYRTPEVIFHIALLGFCGASCLASAADPLVTWHQRTSPYGATNSWRGIAFGNGRFVTCGSKGLVATSTDGSNWLAQSAGTPDDFYSVAFGGGIFVGTGKGGLVATSSDGATWQLRDPNSAAHLYHISCNNGLFLAVSDGGVILSSPDGVAWTPRVTANTNRWRASAYGNGTHLVVGYRSDSSGSHTRAAVSAALSGWNLLDTGAQFYLSGATFGSGRFVACGYAGLVQSSSDGVNWTAPAYAGHEWLNFVTYADNTFVAVGESETIVSSTDGVTWTNRYSGQGFGVPTLQAVAFGNKTWVAVGFSSVIFQSDPVSGSGGSGIVMRNPTRDGSRFSFMFDGELGQRYAVHATTDFVNWPEVTNVICTVSPMPCTVLGQTMPARYYRVVKP